jgi:hypothetical protein
VTVRFTVTFFISCDHFCSNTRSNPDPLMPISQE